MPTAARLMAAFVMAITGMIVAQNVVQFLDEGTKIGWLKPVSMIVPALCGWKIAGKKVGNDYNIAVQVGFYVVFVSLLFTTLTFAIAEMLGKSTRKAYDGPMDALVGTLDILLEYGLILLHFSTISPMIIGAVVCGITIEWSHRKFH